MKTSYQLSVPKPCHENWQSMTANEKGKFCNACATTVVDFSGMTTTDVKDYLIQHKEEKVCGRFDQKTLDTINLTISTEVIQKKHSFRKSFLLALLITMGTTLVNCTNTDGKQQKIESIEVVNADLQQKIENNIDTITKEEIKTEEERTSKKSCIDTSGAYIKEPLIPHVAAIIPVKPPERLIGEPALRVTTGMPVLHVPDDEASNRNAPHITESKFAAMLHLISEKKAAAQDFKEYFCDDLEIPISVNSKRITFLNFCKKIHGKKTKIKDVSIRRDADNCIVDIEIKYRNVSVFDD